MVKIFNLNAFAKARLHLFSLAFFMICISGCKKKVGWGEISVLDDNDKPVALFIPSDMLEPAGDQKLEDAVKIRLKGNNVNMLGGYQSDNYGLKFTPLIALSRGAAYEVLINGKVISVVNIPLPKASVSAAVSHIYPSADTLPENLLKIYVTFTQPMRQGVSKRYISLLNSRGDTLPDTFLNLETELWDESGKELTLWLDPGRIKKGLQPNEAKGAPLKSSHHYEVVISGQWKDLKGNALVSDFSKKFQTQGKDTESPDPVKWQLNLPAAGSRQAITISFNESLDHSLLANTIQIIHRDGQPVNGRLIVQKNETEALFYPINHWVSGIYYLKIDSKLEDLAGNNLIRLFDRDLTKPHLGKNEESYTRQFTLN